MALTRLVVETSELALHYVAMVPGVLRSIDGGSTWEIHQHKGLPQGRWARSPCRLWPSVPPTLGKVYVIVERGVYHSDDGGATCALIGASKPRWFWLAAIRLRVSFIS